MNGQRQQMHNEKRILVCLSSSTSNAKVIHAAANITEAYQGTLIALFVETPAYIQASDDDKKRLRSNMNLAEKLGARVDTVSGEDVPYQIAEYARLSDISCIVIGQTNTVGGLLRKKKSLTDRLVAYAPDLDYFIIPDYGTKVFFAKKPQSKNAGSILRNCAIFLAALGSCTLVGLLFSNLGFTDANIIMVYLLGLLIVSMFTTHRAFSLVWAVTSVLLFDLLFTTPRFTFYAYGTGYPVTFVVMFAAAFIISTLAIRLKQNASQSAKAAQRMSVVLDTDRQLAKAKAPDEIFSVLAAQLSQLLKRSLVIYPSDGESLLNPNFYPTADDTVPYRADREKEAVDWAFRQHKRAGATTEAYPQTDYLYYSLRIQERVYGVVGVAVHGSPLDASEQSVLASVVGECSLALENARNAREKEESILLAENERLRANLLRAVSHDLRTPLTSIMGNADNLITSGETLDPATRAQVYHDIYNDAQWLTGMVENPLSASRMNEGKLNLNITTELMDDLIGEAVRHLGKRLDAFVFEWRKPDQLLFVRADARLIVQVILNLLDNAMKYTQPGSHIWIRTGKENGEVMVCVEDDGPGIPDDQKPHIFDLFYTSGNPAGDSRRGLGVGLALCQSILKAHDGRIWVTDRIPRGVCFEFALPEEKVTAHE